MTEPTRNEPEAHEAPARCTCGGERPPARHHVDITVGQHTVIVTSDAPHLADVVQVVRELFDHSRPTPREAAGFTAGSAPASAISDRRPSYPAQGVLPGYAGPPPADPPAPVDLSWITYPKGVDPRAWTP